MPPISASGEQAAFSTAILACLGVLLAHAGFALYATGLCRAKNACVTMAINSLVWALAAIGFFVAGFAFMCGAAWPAAGLDRWLVHVGDWGIVGSKGFFLNGRASEPGVLFFFFLMMCRVTITAAIPTGALAERWKFKSFFFFSLLVGMLLAPICGAWIWGGWIAQLGSKLGWGHGGVDYAGSSVIHLTGAAIALSCTWLIGPRIGKFDPRGRPRPMLGHHVPMAVTGCLFLAFSWMALNVASSLAAADGRVVLVVVNSVLAGASGAAAACVFTVLSYGKPDPTLMCNGLLGGIVAIAAPCAFVQPWAALLIGAVAGVLAVLFVSFWEQRGIDDPVGVVSVHGVNGLWGMLALGLFADGSFGNGYNGVTSHGVTGLFYGDSKQLLSQCAAAAACIIWGIIAGGAVFQFVGRFFGPNRVPRDVELSGLDIPEVGIPAYRELLNPVTASTGFAAEPRPASAPIVGGQKRFSVVIEGVDSSTLIGVWSGFCQTGASPPSEQFREVYPFLTTVTGNRFRFSGGDPARVKENLTELFAKVMPDKSVSARIES